MWNEPTEAELQALPRLYSTEGSPAEEKVIHLHFFLGASDWYVAEYDPETRNFFGFVVLNGDYQMAEWGYFSLDELRKLKDGPFEVDRDLWWQPTKFKDIRQLQAGLKRAGHPSPWPIVPLGYKEPPVHRPDYEGNGAE